MNGLYACFKHYGVGAVGVEGRCLHFKSVSYPGYVSSDLAECVDAEVFAFEFDAGGAVVHVSSHHYGHSED